MPQDMIPIQPEAALDRVLVDLGRELIEASDREIAEAAEDLGMDVNMRGSAAFLGVFGIAKRLEDIFEVEDLRRAYANFLRGQHPVLPKDDDEDDEV
jgi:hypothetical protein